MNIHDIYAGHCNTAFNVNKRVFFFFSFFPMMTPCSVRMTTEISHTKFNGLVSFVNTNNLIHVNLYFMYFLSCIEIREDYTRIHKDEIKHHSNKNSFSASLSRSLPFKKKTKNKKKVKLNVRRFDFLSLNRSPLCKNRSSSLKRGILKQRPEKPSYTFRK